VLPPVITVSHQIACATPRNASTWPAIPLMALRKMRGRAWRHGCWQGSFTLSVLIANWRNFCVWLITSGLVRLMGLPMVFKKRYQLWAIQSFDIPCVIRSSSPIFNSGNDGPYIKAKTFDVRTRLTRFHCSIRATRCRQFMQHSLKVFQRGGEGKH
jgi:hypothetical protein